jgi:hypothetical protein
MPLGAQLSAAPLSAVPLGVQPGAAPLGAQLGAVPLAAAPFAVHLGMPHSGTPPLSDSQLNGAQLSAVQPDGAQLGGAQLGGAQLGGAQLNGSQLGKAQLGAPQLSVPQLSGSAPRPGVQVGVQSGMGMPPLGSALQQGAGGTPPRAGALLERVVDGFSVEEVLRLEEDFGVPRFYAEEILEEVLESRRQAIECNSDGAVSLAWAEESGCEQEWPGPVLDAAFECDAAFDSRLQDLMTSPASQGTATPKAAVPVQHQKRRIPAAAPMVAVEAAIDEKEAAYRAEQVSIEERECRRQLKRQRKQQATACRQAERHQEKENRALAEQLVAAVTAHKRTYVTAGCCITSHDSLSAWTAISASSASSSAANSSGCVPPPPAAPPPPAPPPSSEPRTSPSPSCQLPRTAVGVEDDGDGYRSDATEQGGRTRRAFLVGEGDDGQAVRLAFGEVRIAEGVFVAAGVSADGADIDIPGGTLAEMMGEVVPLADLDAVELELEWAEEDAELGSERAEEYVELDSEWAEPDAEQTPFEGGMCADDDIDMSTADVDVPAPPAQTAADAIAEAADTNVWQTRAMELEDELQWHRDELLQVQVQASNDVLMACQGADDVRVRVEVDDPQDARKSKLIPMAQLLRECAEKRKKPPILTPTDRVRKAQMTTGTYKARAEANSNALAVMARQLNAARAELEQTKRQHALEREHTAQQHASECKGLQMRHASELKLMAAELDRMERALACQKKRADAIAEWKRIECRRLEKHETQRLQEKDQAHSKELAQRSSRTATWKAKRNHMARALKRASARAERKGECADASAAELNAANADRDALHAELGQCVKVAEQRQANGTRAAFTFNTILRDLKVRQQSLNSGAGNVRGITRTYSEHVAADGRDLQLESGSLATVLRWEKHADVVCMLLEGRRLRQALLDEPRTRLHVYIDLSPDCRAVEQCGMGFEYAIVTYVSPDGDAPPPFAEGRLSSTPLSTSATVQFGVDGCPITIESWRRVFAPMLAALGPKYAATADCFMRMLQLYGSTVGELLDPNFRFATVERHDIDVPLLDRVENFTADGGGEVHKSGGVIDTVAPGSSYRHCGAHGGNLSLKRSNGFDRVGASVRMLSSFCRAGNKHTMLVMHMKCIQQPELYDGSDERLRIIYRDAHSDVKRRGLFHTDLGGREASPAAVGEQMERLGQLALVAKSQLERKSKKGTEVRWKYEFEVLDDRLIDISHLLAPAILIEYGDGAKYAELTINQGTEKNPKNKTAASALATLRDPTFLFWATYLRLLYTRVYKGLFVAVQANHHHAAPLLAGSDGLPMQWAAAMREGFVSPQGKNGKPRLSDTACAPLIKLLETFPILGGANGEHAAAAIVDLEAQVRSNALDQTPAQSPFASEVGSASSRQAFRPPRPLPSAGATPRILLCEVELLGGARPRIGS